MAMRDYAPSPDGRGDPCRPSGPHRLRIGDAERDAATADLGEHYAAGRLTLDEFHERVDTVLAATTFGQLAVVMEDLPGPGRLPWNAGPGGYWRGVRPGFQKVGGWDSVGLPSGESGSTDRGGRFAALALLLLAMLIWLFTALLFVRHGFYAHMGPVSPPVPGQHFLNPGGFHNPGGFNPGGFNAGG